MRVTVLGAGVVGVASAWYLARAGFEVTVVDRQSQPAAETSFANGGQISVSHAEPWANPQAPLKVLKWLARSDAPLLFRPRADWRQWWWLAGFLRECTAARTRENIRRLVALGLYSREALRALREETGIDYHAQVRGIVHFYTDPAEFEAAREPARLMTELGCERRVVSAAEAVTIEPALASIGPSLVGATFSPGDESGDARVFTRELARRCEALGVRFLYGHHVTALRAAAGGIDHAEAIDAGGGFVRLDSDRWLLAAGSWSALLAAPLGIRLNLYPAKGYSVTMPVADPEAAWQASLTDDSHKLVFSRLGERLRIAGTAELSGWDRSLNRRRCEAILARVRQLFPRAGEAGRAEFWSGLRPATPSNLPYLGPTRYPNLHLNTGHGTLGWTLACGSGRVVADMVAGRRPEISW
ncbi:D-amino acid dehydrogenase [Burkholderiaceae bacterium FT117]|uniref:D-amino acid dehydrogenase n=1 Tax=Zeimonas sediminis TaxID=2944268 RepID=UPI0023431A01|nr:D-amino acid dehydrogenase [Zeimonas sediminis]MCM5571259.1 D-amino acid dehydrogenase [Zeimonas sediminis]